MINDHSTSKPEQPGSRRLRVGYLVNRHPRPSHTFITNEVLALEESGIPVCRMAIRGWDEVTLSAVDRAEQKATSYVLERGLASVLASTVQVAVRAPGRFAKALGEVWALTRRGGTSLARNLVYLAEACRVAQVARAQAVDHLHAHFGTNPAAVVMLAGALSGLPFSFTVHGPEEFDRPDALKLGEKIRAAAFVVAISSFGRSQLYRWSDLVDWPKIKVVRCGLDDRFLATPLDDGGTGKTFVCVGRLCEQKGQLLLLQAFAELVAEEPDARLILAGDGEMRPQVEAAIARLGLAGAVEITGWLSNDEVRSLVLASDALVLASFAEGLPVVIMEALALGRPVISTYIAGIPELIRDGREGLLVAAGDVTALRDRMLAFLRLTPQERLAMRQRGKARVAERHDAAAEAARLAGHFAEAVATRRP